MVFPEERDQMSDASLEALYSEPLPSDRTGALYSAFSYPTKISAESVGVFIACHTQPGDHVLDVFGGSGSTGIGALLCQRPTDRMLAIAAARGLKPVWGKRFATVYELSEIGSLLARVMTSAPSPDEFVAAATSLLAAAEVLEPDLYSAPSPDGQAGRVRQIIWSEIVRCPRCDVEQTYADQLVLYDPLRFNDTLNCDCGFAGAPRDWPRVTEHFTDPWSGEVLTRRRRVPWRVYGASASGNWVRHALDSDSIAEGDATNRDLPPGAPIAKLHWGDLYRSGYHQGMTHLHHLYTARNFRAIATLWSLIDDQPAHLCEALRLLVLSYNASHSTLMTRVVLKKGSKDFIVTGAQSGVLYISGLPLEKNVFTGLRRKISIFEKAFGLLHGLEEAVDVVTASSTDLHLEDETVDYVFTDPPFGAYIPYAEINQVNELWLERTTETREEAIISPSQGKDVDAYKNLLTGVFREVARCMKPMANATLVFHSSKAAVWQALVETLRDSNLVVSAASILDKTQASFKQVNGHVAVTGDPLLRLTKVASDRRAGSVDMTMQDMVATARSSEGASSASRRDQQRLFSRVVGDALVNGVPVTLDARRVYELQDRD
jgi:16S rRNA G966 N2-methylase RsmD